MADHDSKHPGGANAATASKSCRRKRQHYALGFGSNYFGALGGTVVPPPPTTLPPTLEGAAGADEDPTAARLSAAEVADGPYRWGHVRFLSLGQEHFARHTRKTSIDGQKNNVKREGGPNSTDATSINMNGGRTVNANKTVKANNGGSKGKAGKKAEIQAGSVGGRKAKSKTGGGGGGHFKKGFLLSAKAASSKSKRRKERNDNHHQEATSTTNTNQQAADSADVANTMESSSEPIASKAKQEHVVEDAATPADDREETDDAEDDDSGALPASLASPPILMAVGSTHTVYCADPSCSSSSSSSSSSSGGCTIMQSGTIHGRPSLQFVPIHIRMPLRCLQLSCGKRHVLALMGDGPRIASTRLGLFDGPIRPCHRNATTTMTGGGDVDGDDDNDDFPVSPIRSAYEALSSGIVMAWGAGHFGQLGLGPDVTDCSKPCVVEMLSHRTVGGPVVHVCAGPLHSAAIVATSASHTRTFCFGSNRRGQCGVEKCNTVPFPRPLDEIVHPEQQQKGRSVNFVRVSLGRLHGVGLSDTGEVYTWGSNTSGRLGHGDCTSAGAAKAGRGIRTPRRIDALKNVCVVQVSAGDGHTLALTGSGRVFAWGSNSEGQLGHAHTMNYHSPRLVGDLDFAGIHSTYSADGKLLPRKPDTSSGTANAAATQEGEFRSSSTSMAASEKTALVDAIDGSPDQKNKTPPALPKYMPVQAIQNSVPERSSPNNIPKIVAICASGDYSGALSSAGDLYTFGYGDGGQIGHDAPQNLPGRPSLPYVEPGPRSKTGAGHRIRDSCSFDSRLNILVPRRVEVTREIGLRVDQVFMGPNNMILICSSKAEGVEDESVGLTLYEIETRRRALGLSKLRMLSSKKISISKVVGDDEKEKVATNRAESQLYRESVPQIRREKATSTQTSDASLPDPPGMSPDRSTVSARRERADSLSSPFRLLKKTKEKIMNRK